VSDAPNSGHSDRGIRRRPIRAPALWRMLVVAGLLLSACQEPVPPATSAPAVPISTKTPEDAARSLLNLLREQLHAAARADRPAVARLRELALDRLVARPELERHITGLAQMTEAERTELFHKLVDSWAAAIAYYADGLALDQLKALGPTAGARVADLVVPARTPDDTAILHVYCQRTSGEEWRVIGLELVPPRTPATAPASSPGA